MKHTRLYTNAFFIVLLLQIKRLLDVLAILFTNETGFVLSTEPLKPFKQPSEN